MEKLSNEIHILKTNLEQANQQIIDTKQADATMKK